MQQNNDTPLRMRKLYNVNGITLRLVRVDFIKLPNIKKGIIQYVFTNRNNRIYKISNRNQIKEISQ